MRGPNQRWSRPHPPVAAPSPPSHMGHRPLAALPRSLTVLEGFGGILEYASPHKQYQGLACRYLSPRGKLEKPPILSWTSGYSCSARALNICKIWVGKKTSVRMSVRTSKNSNKKIGSAHPIPIKKPTKSVLLYRYRSMVRF